MNVAPSRGANWTTFKRTHLWPLVANIREPMAAPWVAVVISSERVAATIIISTTNDSHFE